MPVARTSPRRRYASPRIARVIDRIRGLVAEERRLERAGDCGRVEALRREIAKLQEQLASMVRAELGQPQT